MCDNKLGCGNNFDQFAEVHDADEEIQTIVDQVRRLLLYFVHIYLILWRE